MEQQVQIEFFEQDYLDEILEKMQDGIYITDNEANTVFLNHSYERISGLFRAEMIGQNMQVLVDTGVINVSGTLAVLKTGEPITIEQSFRTGKRAIITSSPVYEDPKNKQNLFMVVTIVREITELYSMRREMQRLLAQNLKYADEIAQLIRTSNGETEMVAVAADSEQQLRLAERVAVADVPVLISGEDGVGKDKLAHYIHNHSRRSGRPFIRITSTLLPKENQIGYLFGSVDAATGAYHAGLLEAAEGGTVYVKEIFRMPEAMRERFMTLLQDGSYIMGDGSCHSLDIRFIVSSRYSYKELQELDYPSDEILQYFSAFPMEIKPLRERRDDIVPLADYFIREHNRRTGEKKSLSKRGCQSLLFYDWPGNVQELKVVIQRAIIVSREDVISDGDLLFDGSADMAELSVDHANEPETYESGTDFFVHERCSNLKYETARLEAHYMQAAFDYYRNIRDAAKSLGIDSSTFVRKRQKYREMGLMREE